jgi:hypothetical protein
LDGFAPREPNTFLSLQIFYYATVLHSACRVGVGSAPDGFETVVDENSAPQTSLWMIFELDNEWVTSAPYGRHAMLRI